MKLLAVLISLLFIGGKDYAELDRKIAPILPRAEEESFLQIPWEINLMQARAKSQQVGRPMLVWVMTGHVLGCT